MDDLIQVLTVTARRLASVKLGRKYSGNKTSPAELKKTTTCAACGEVGHWRGDDVCKVSGKGASSATSSSQPSASARKTHFKEMPAPKSKPHQTFTVMHSDLGSYELHSGYGTAFEDPNAYQINVVFNTQEVPFSKSFVGYMVLDTACQRTCCGRTWAYNHGKLIAESGLQPIKAERRDTFQFGKGDPIVADCRMYMPAALENGNVFYVGAGVLDAEVPLLASNPFLKALGMVLDLNRMVVHFERLSAHVPVLNLGGHVAVNIACLDSQTAARLSELEHVVDWQRPAPELLIEQLDSLPEGDACHTPAMAATVEVHHDIADPLQAGPLPHDVPSSSSSHVGLGMDDHRNSSSPGLRDQPGPLRPQRHLPLRQRQAGSQGAASARQDGSGGQTIKNGCFPCNASSRSSALPLPSSDNTAPAAPPTPKSSLRAAAPKTRPSSAARPSRSTASTTTTMAPSGRRSRVRATQEDDIQACRDLLEPPPDEETEYDWGS